MDGLNLERLLKIRLAVARYGEMDSARWWNTQGVLGRHGSTVYSRGFPRTHEFVRAKVVFSVAQARCKEVFDPPASITLWNLPPETEDEFESQWEFWLDDSNNWTPFFAGLESLNGGGLTETLAALNLISPEQVAVVAKMKRSAEGRAVPISGTHDLDDDLVALLAAGFSLGESGSPAIPYLRLDSLR